MDLVVFGSLDVDVVLSTNSPPQGLDFSKSDESHLVVHSGIFQVAPDVTITGPSELVDDCVVGFVQNVISQDLAGYYGTQDNGVRFDITFADLASNSRLSLPLLDSGGGTGSWYVNPADCALPATTLASGAGMSKVTVQPVLSDNPGHKLPWMKEGFSIAKVAGHTTFTWWLIIRRKSSGDWAVLRTDSWKVVWDSFVQNHSAAPISRVQSVHGSGASPCSRVGPPKPVIDPPTANDVAADASPVSWY